MDSDSSTISDSSSPPRPSTSATEKPKSVGRQRQRSLKETNPLKYGSAIYDYYFKKTGDEPDLFRCMKCDSVVKKGRGGQTNLKKHFERNHGNIYQEQFKATRVSISCTF